MCFYFPSVLEVSSSCLHLTDNSSTCWLFIRDAVQTWGGASQSCIALGGHLAVESNATVRAAVRAELGCGIRQVEDGLGRTVGKFLSFFTEIIFFAKLVATMIADAN